MNNLFSYGFNDREDGQHLAALKKCADTEGITPIFVTHDLDLHNYQKIIREQMNIYLELPMYAINRYNNLSNQIQS